MTKIVTGILAHVDAGKTTLSEAVLYKSGTIRKQGFVDKKDAFLDTYGLERERGITIFSKQAEFMLGEKEITLLDTPGHVDFSAEMERTLQVLDYAILVISGMDGVQGHTLTLWRLFKQYDIPVFLFVNKTDQMEKNDVKIETVMNELQARLSDSCIYFGQNEDSLYDALAMCSEKAMETYLEEGIVPEDEIREMIAERQVFPCFAGSALRLEGVDDFLKGLEKYLKEPSYPETFSARVYKIGRDNQGNRLTHMKITGGELKVKDLISGNGNNDWSEKVNQIRIYNSLKYETVDVARAGTICAVTGLSETKAGEGLGDLDEHILPVLEPVLTYRIILPDGISANKVMGQFKQLEEEEPALHIVWEEEAREIHAQLMGDVQIEILRHMIKERFDLDVEFGSGRILYKETIAEPVEGIGHFEPLRHYAEVHLLMEPDEAGSGLSFASSVNENELDRNWQRLILTHLEEREHKGVLTGSPITDMKITLVAGKAHLKHTEGGDFRQATYRAVRQGLMKARSVILEPFYQFKLELPSVYVGRAMTDIEQMQGKFELMTGDDGESILSGTAPVATMREYHKTLMSYSGGKGRLFCSLGGYQPCHNPDEVWQEIYYDPERDLDHPADSVFCGHGAGFVVPWYEVESYMHLPGLGLENSLGPDNPDFGSWYQARNNDTADVQIARTRTVNHISYENDDELQAIFERTYGKVERKLHDSSRTIYAPRKEKEYVYKAPKNVKPLDHYLLVDGYNIIFAWPDLAKLAQHSLDAARSKLMDILSNYQGYTKDKIILVFDAYKVQGFQGEVVHWQNIDIVYTKEAETADQYIEKTAHVMGRKYKVSVATSDGTEQVIIRSQGCLLMSARDLLKEVDRINEEIREDHLDKNQRTGNYIGNYMPEELK